MAMSTLSHAPLRDVDSLRAEFDGGRDYLSACTLGVMPRAVRNLLIHDINSVAAGRPDPHAYTAAVQRSRELFARMVSLDSQRIAVGSQVSVLGALIATAVPDGGEVLVPAGDFSSVALPFVHAGRGVTVRAVPLAELADSITHTTSMVAFSLVQSATGDVADAERIVAQAHRFGARTYCDATQAVGWLPVDASMFDALTCHAYKWLCAPRGAAFLAVSEDLQSAMRPLFAGWYAGADPWASCYGHEIDLAKDASQFDVSPAWQVFLGAAAALEIFATADQTAVSEYTTGLAAKFRELVGIAPAARPSAIVTWADADGSHLARLTSAGITASGRAGRARVAFHVFNDQQDVYRAAEALLG